MTKNLFTKLLRDLWGAWGRISLMIMAIALSLMVFGTVLYARTLVDNRQAESYTGSNPSSSRVSFDPGIKPEEQAALRNIALKEPGVIDASLRSTFTLKVESPVGGSDVATLGFFAIPKDDALKISKFNIIEGSWPPEKGTLLLEKSELAYLKKKVGDDINVIRPDKQVVPFKIAGVVEDPGLTPASTGGVGYSYITEDSLPLLGRPATFNQIALTIADTAGSSVPSRDRDTIVKTSTAVVNRIEAERGVTTDQVAVPPPYEHPHQFITNALLLALLTFGTLALVLSAILIATMFNGLLSQQIPQIGMMKAIGATNRRIITFYLLMILLIAGIATALAFYPAIVFGKLLAEMVLGAALSLEIGSATIPLWAYGATIAAGIAVPVVMSLGPIISAGRRTVREAMDERGVSGQGVSANGLYSKLSKIGGLNRTMLMAFRNIFRRKTRFFLSAGLLAIAGTIFVAGMNTRAGFQSIPNTIANEYSWDVDIKMPEPADTDKVASIVSQVPGVTKVETWNTTQVGIQYAGEVNVTRTYPDQGHGSIGMTGIPKGTTTLNPPEVMEGRWLNDDDTDAIVLPQSIYKTLPGIKVGDKVELTIEEKITSWQVVGIVKELAAGACPCVTQTGFQAATGMENKVNMLRLTTDNHTLDGRNAIGKNVEQALAGSKIKSQSQAFDGLLKSADSHTDILISLILTIATVIAIVGLVGLGSTMSTNVVERTREFGIMNAIGAPASTVRMLVVYEGVFIALVSLVVALVPAALLTLGFNAGLGYLFFSAPIPFVVSPEAVLIWTGVVLIGAAFATLLPAYRASKLTVREALAYL